MVTLVTGGTGFVGANIVKDLVQNGHQVVSFDINGPDQLLQDFLGESSSSVIFVQGDIVDPASVERLGQDHQIDKIVHAAVYTVNREALEIERSRDVIAINLEGTANLLELARTEKVSRFIYVSSGAVYGSALPGDQTLNEETPAVPGNLYGITKFASEMITRRSHGAGYRAPGRDVGLLRLDWPRSAGGDNHRRRHGPGPGLYLYCGHRRRHPGGSRCLGASPRPL